MIRSLMLSLAFCLSLTACGNTPPAPVDRFYRLQPVSLTPPAKPIAVQPLRADSLYAERPLVYSDDNGMRQLRQYHYHLWLYAPAQLVQDHLTASLGAAANAAGRRLEGRILRFDRIVVGKESRAVVALELSLNEAGKPLFSKTYTAERQAADASVTAHVVAVEQALAAIYGQFLQDAER